MQIKRLRLKRKKKKKKKEKKENEIERLKEEVENNKDKLLDHLLAGEDKISKLLTDLKFEKHDTLDDIMVLESRLIELEILPTQIDEIKD